MPWMEITFTSEEEKEGLPSNLINKISSAYSNRPNPQTMVLYRTVPGTGLARYYVSSEAAEIVMDYLHTLRSQKTEAPDLTALIPLPLKL